MSEKNKALNNKTQDDGKPNNGLNYNPSEKIKKLVEIFEKKVTFTPRNSKEESNTLGILNDCSQKIKEIEKGINKLSEKDKEQFNEVKDSLLEKTKSTLKSMADNRVKRKSSWFFGCFRKSHLLDALVNNKIYDRQTGEINIKNFTEVKQAPKLGGSVMTQTAWANITYGCSLSQKILEGIKNNKVILDYLQHGGSMDNIDEWKMDQLIKDGIVPELDQEKLCGDCSVAKQCLFSSVGDLDDWGDAQIQKLAEEDENRSVSKIRQHLINYDKNFDDIKNKINADVLKCSGLYDLVKCYFRLMVLNQACQMVQYFNITGNSLAVPQAYTKPSSINEESYNKYMSSSYPNLYKLDIAIYKWIAEQTIRVVFKIQTAACLAVLNKLNIEMSDKRLPKGLEDSLLKKFNDGMKGCAGARPLGFNSLKGDVIQQIKEAMQVLYEYAQQHS